MFWVGKLLVLAFAGSAETSLLQPYSTEFIQNEVMALRPVSGHHFNLKAPQKCGHSPWLDKTPMYLGCQLANAGKVPITVSICDDKVTFCKVEKFEVNVKGSGKGTTSNVKYVPKAQPLHQPEGFITNDPEAALKQAREQKKLLFVDFFGIWCPPCNMLDEYVFGQPEFLAASSDFIKVRLDADSDLSWKWKDHFYVGGYPTVIIADSQLREIGRWVGYAPTANVVKWMKEQLALRDVPVEVALSGAKTPANVLRVGRWYYERAEYRKAADFLKSAKGREARGVYLRAVRALAEDQDDKEGLKKALVSLLEENPGELAYADWAIQLVDLAPEIGKPYLGKAIEKFEKMNRALDTASVKKQLDESGYVAGDIPAIIADLLQTNGQETAAKPYFVEAAKKFQEMAKQSKLPVARGANLSVGYFLYMAGDYAAAKSLYQTLVKAYGDEFTFNYSYAQTLKKLKEYDEAYRYAKTAEQNAYGDNWLRAVALRAELDLAMNRKSDAKTNLEKALTQVVPPKSTQVRSHRYIAQLRKLLSQTI